MKKFSIRGIKEGIQRAQYDLAHTLVSAKREIKETVQAVKERDPEAPHARRRRTRCECRSRR